MEATQPKRRSKACSSKLRVLMKNHTQKKRWQQLRLLKKKKRKSSHKKKSSRIQTKISKKFHQTKKGKAVCLTPTKMTK